MARTRPSIADDDYVRVIGPDTGEILHKALGRVSGPDHKGESTAKCPAHPDDEASLRYRVSIDGRALLYCHAGCTYAEIQAALQMESWELAPVRVEYDYLGPQGDYRFTVIREHKADGKKKVYQGVRGLDGNMQYDVSEVDQDVLFRGDEIVEAARGAAQVVWVPEGEKDATCLSIALGEDGVVGEYAVSFHGGAGRDLTGVAGRLLEATGARQIVIVCDRDKSGAGERRGRTMAALLAEEASDLIVTVLMPKEGSGKDVAEVYDRFGAKWRDHFEPVEVDVESDAVLAFEGSTGAGGMVRVPTPGGRNVLAIVKGEAPIQVLSGCVEPIAAWGGDKPGWRVLVSNQLPGIESVEVDLLAADLSTNRAFQVWLARTTIARVVVGTVGVGHGDIADALRLYLQYRAIALGVETMIVPDAAGWVDADTGRNADEAEGSRSLVFLSGEGEVVTKVGEIERIYAAPTGAGSEADAYKRRGTEAGAAWALWQALTFADADVTAPVLGFAAATILSPFLRAAGCAVRPGLAVVAQAESGKTTGAIGMILKMAGTANQKDSTPAAFRRMLQRGVGTILWIDDSSLIEDDGVKKWMRTAASREKFEMSNTDAGHNSTIGGWLTAAPAVSAEGVGWLKEKAMADRFVVVSPTNPKSRTSWWRGHDESLQWGDYQRVEEAVAYPQSISGWVVEGLMRAAAARGAGDAFKGVREAFSRSGEGVGRRAGVQAAVSTGLDLMIDWMDGVRKEAGAAWPGVGEDWAESADWIRTGLRKWRDDGFDETEAASCGLVNDVLPVILTENLRTGSTNPFTGTVAAGIDATSKESFVAGVRHHVGGVGGASIARGWPAVIVDTEGRLWVQIRTVSASYEAVTRGRGGRVETVSVTALEDHLRGVRDNPEWAHYSKGGGRKATGCEVWTKEVGKQVYNRLSEAASVRARGLASGE